MDGLVVAFGTLVIMALVYGWPLFIGITRHQWKLGLGLSAASIGVAMASNMVWGIVLGGAYHPFVGGLTGIAFEVWAVYRVLQAARAA
jgi:hypothetical protein